MISSGRCHGPGCRETADNEFCGPACVEAWHAQFRWLHGDGPAERPQSGPRTCPRCGATLITDWVDVTEAGQPPASEFVAGNARCPSGHWDLQSETLQRLVPTVDETHVWGPEQVQAAGRLTHPARQRALAMSELLVSTSDAYPLVASRPDPTRNWLSRLLDRWTGRTP